MPKQVGKLSVLWSEIIIVKINDEDFINLIDIAKYKDPERTDYIIQNRLRNRNTIETFKAYESWFITPISIPSNSMDLKTMPDLTAFPWLPKDELAQREQLA